jgi:hypothetical protein
MAKQIGVVNLSGTIGDTTYIRRKKGFYARQKTKGISERVRTSPRYRKLRAHMAEFTTAARAGKLLRDHLFDFVGKCRDIDVAKRLTTVMLAAVKLDKINPLGRRNMLDGEVALLERFEFTGTGSLSATLEVEPAGTIDRETGEVYVDIAALNPFDVMKWPQTATHYRVSIAAAAINFESGAVEKKFLDGPYQPLLNEENEAVSLSVSLIEATTDPILLFLKLEFFEDVNGGKNIIMDNSFSSCSVIKVDTGV